MIAGTKLTKGDRIVTGAASAIPVVSGPMLRSGVRGVKIAAKKAVVKNGEKIKDVTVKGGKKIEKAVKKNVSETKGGNGVTSSKPNQLHHYATNKSKTYTPQLEEMANKYNLVLDDAWNKDEILQIIYGYRKRK